DQRHSILTELFGVLRRACHQDILPPGHPARDQGVRPEGGSSGIGVRYSVTAADGQRLAVICHSSGRRDLAVFASVGADAAQSYVPLTTDQAHDVADLLHPHAIVNRLADPGTGAASRVVTLPVGAGSRYVGSNLADLDARLPADVRALGLLRAGQIVAVHGDRAVINSGDIVIAAGNHVLLEVVAAELATGDPT
ncbi:TrkA C-terminal domain-containing protein, partial [Catellatospora sichuanensis]|uniref:TrkA C-terminal domain-containing protein n=1 Tax=Catellatospora sichuanensis TaxID=1969805 RepID=UPI0011835E82